MDTNTLQQLIYNPKETAKIDFKREMYKLFMDKPVGQSAIQKWAKDQSNQWGELVKDIIAITNGNSGTARQIGYLIIGADDKLQADGTPRLQSITGKRPIRRDILDKVNSYCDRPLLDIECEEILLDGVNLFVISIPPMPHLYSLSKELETPTQNFSPHTVFLRRGDGEKTYPASFDEQMAIREEKRSIFPNPSSEEVKNNFQRELDLNHHKVHGITGAMESSYWRIRIFPQTYNAQLIERSECLNLIKRTKVEIGGWNYPSIPSGGIKRTGSNWIGYLGNQSARSQSWVLYESGHFIDISGTFPTEAANDIDRIIGNKFITDGEIIYTITSVFRFAANLCQQEIYAGGVNIEIALENLWNYRFKLESDLNDLPSQSRKATEDSYQKTWVMQGNSLSLTSDDKGLDAIVWFAECFCSPQEIPKEVFKEKQEKLLGS